MIQLTPQARILVALEPVDFRRGIDGLARIASQELRAEPFSGCVFILRSPSRRARWLNLEGNGEPDLCPARARPIHPDGRSAVSPGEDGRPVLHPVRLSVCITNR